MNKELRTGFRSTPQEKKALLLLSELEGVKPSEMLRLLIREGLMYRGYPKIGLIKTNQYLRERERVE